VSEQFLNGTSAHIRLFSAIHSFRDYILGFVHTNKEIEKGIGPQFEKTPNSTQGKPQCSFLCKQWNRRWSYVGSTAVWAFCMEASRNSPVGLWDTVCIKHSWM